MVTIRPQAEGYKMTFSNPGSGWRGYSHHARTLAEVKCALDHYFGATPGHGSKPLAAECPLCRATAQPA